MARKAPPQAKAPTEKPRSASSLATDSRNLTIFGSVHDLKAILLPGRDSQSSHGDEYAQHATEVMTDDLVENVYGHPKLLEWLGKNRARSPKLYLANQDGIATSKPFKEAMENTLQKSFPSHQSSVERDLANKDSLFLSLFLEAESIPPSKPGRRPLPIVQRGPPKQYTLQAVMIFYFSERHGVLVKWMHVLPVHQGNRIGTFFVAVVQFVCNALVDPNGPVKKRTSLFAQFPAAQVLKGKASDFWVNSPDTTISCFFWYSQVMCARIQHTREFSHLEKFSAFERIGYFENVVLRAGTNIWMTAPPPRWPSLASPFRIYWTKLWLRFDRRGFPLRTCLTISSIVLTGRICPLLC